MNDTNVILNFDASTVDPTFGGGGGFFPVSDKKGHLVVASGSNGFKTANSGKGQFLEIVLTGQEGAVAGQEAVLRLNLMHENPQAVQAAYGQLSAIAHVTGVMRIGAISDIFNRPFRVVSVEQKQSEADKAAGKTPFTQLGDNGILDANGNPPGKGAVPAGPAQTAPQMTGGPAPVQQQGNPFQQGGPAQQQQQQQQAAPDWGQQAAQQQQQGNPFQQQAQPAQQGNPFQQGQAGGAPSWGQGQGQ